MSSDCEWLIVGGGLHGTHLAILLRSRGVPAASIRMLDPHPEALARWRTCTRNTGMDHLRSPIVHHLDLDPFALSRFARQHGPRGGHRGRSDNRPPPVSSTGKPTLAAFDAHCDHLIEAWRLRDLHILGSASEIHGRRVGGLRVVTADGELTARRIVLALGAGDQPAWPRWARSAANEPESTPTGGARRRLLHLFDPNFRRHSLGAWRHAVVIGGGLSAAQAALGLAARQPGRVTLLSRHLIRVSEYDVDPCWMGPMCLEKFDREGSPANRRALITSARQRGSIPRATAARLRRAVARGDLSIRFVEVEHARTEAGDYLLAERGGNELRADLVVLATGFDRCRPGGPLVDQAVDELGLVCAACGYPIVASSLEWTRGLHVMGPLAELELGPTARNIQGARRAAQRIAAA